MIYNDINNDIYNEISDLKKEIYSLQSKVFDIRFILIQLVVDIGWNDEEIKNVIQVSDDELKFLRS